MQPKQILQQAAIWIVLLLSLQAKGQNALLQKVQNAENRGLAFVPVNLFSTTTGNMHEDAVGAASLLKADISATSSLYQSKPGAIQLTITTIAGKSYTLKMLQSHPLAGNADVGYIDANGRHQCAYDEGVHYQGVVDGAERSMAALSIFADGTIMGLFGNDEGNFVIGKLTDGSGNYILYNDRDLKVQPKAQCHVFDTKQSTAVNDIARTTGVNICNKVKVYWECDYDMNVFQGGFSATQTYLTGLFNQVQTLYANENIAVELVSMYIWTVQDTYNSSMGASQVYPFMAYWNGRGNSFTGDVAMFITHDGGGGIAAINGINNRSYAYGYSGLNGTYSTVPTYSWDATTPTHEMGHQCGLYHTHNCMWHTGPGGTCGAIDNCYTIESSSGCSTCGSTDSVSKGGFTGTIMSYCHLTPIGVNLANGFGPLPGNAVRNNISTCGNLSSFISVTLTPTSICNNDGAVNLTFNTDNFGTAPYAYYWSGGKTSQNISGLSLPGSYIVTITDSNKCVASLTVNVPKFATPGNGVSPNFQPICCKDTSFSYTLSASVPANLLPCQTVAWLRTTAPVTTYAAAQTAFNSASTTDIMYSANSATINSTTAAVLDVPSPVPCNIQSYYYTPFISKKARAVFTLNDSNTTMGAVYAGTAQIGNFTTLANNTSLITVCDASNDTMTTHSLLVTITGYTGRANYMTISVQNSGGNELYSLQGQAGNGTYTIPVHASDNMLQYMKISAYDLNYKNSDTAYASTVSIKAVRKLSYPAITKPDFETVCSTGSSAQVSFAPTACVHLNTANLATADNSIHVYPNPGADAVTLEFSAHTNGSGIVLMTDVMGRTVQTIPVEYTVGNNKKNIDVHAYANGIYFLSFMAENETNSRIKLIVEK
jgi:hypothetical protein